MRVFVTGATGFIGSALVQELLGAGHHVVGLAVHRLDAARAFRLALEAAPSGTRLNAVGDEGVPFRDIAQVIGHHLNLPVTAISPEEAEGHFGLFALFASWDVPVSSVMTQEQFGWHPTHPGLIADLDEGHYFTGAPYPAEILSRGYQACHPSPPGTGRQSAGEGPRLAADVPGDGRRRP